MKIDTTLIEGYTEMSAEQKLEALESFEYEDNSAELERMKNAVSKANSEAADWKKKHNALLSEDEQKKQQDAETLAEMQKELDLLRKDKTIAEYKAQYIAQGMDAKLAEDTAKALAEGDMEKVFANQAKHNEALEKKIKADLMNKTPSPDGSGGDDSKKDSAVEKAKEIAKAKAGGNSSYADIMSKYKK